MGGNADTKIVIGLEDLGELLPGILNDLTLKMIATKLPLRDLLTLSKTSRSWQHAVQGRWVYDARVRYHSTEPLAVIGHIVPDRDCYPLDDHTHVLGLYSITDKAWYDLPPFPLRGGFRYGCQCISLDGKLYVMGGSINYDADDGTKEVYVLDLGGQWQWTQCASMHAARMSFGAGVLNGKIYVFGGCTDGPGPDYGCEVYDPKDKAWSSIPSLFANRFCHQVAAVGEEFYIYGGVVDNRTSDISDESDLEYMDTGKSVFLDVYHAAKDETREIEYPVISNWDAVFIANERFHRLTLIGIEVYDFDKHSWSPLHSFPGFPTGIKKDALPGLGSIMALGDEIIIVQRLKDAPGLGSCLLQSKGFGGKNKEISWAIVKDLLQVCIGCPCLCSIQV